VLAGVFISTLYLIPFGESYPEPRRAQIIDAGDEWILQYDIINNQERDVKYNIYVTIDGAVYTDSTVVKPGKTYTYIHHIYPQQLAEGKVTFVLYEDGRAEPVEQATYYVNLN
jgi:hypothetical protein